MDFTPERDASLGLVFRLNFLWAQTDYAALAADYDKWNNLLDRIYCNLLYREDMVVEEEKGVITKITLSSKDAEKYSLLSRKIHVSKIKWRRSVGKEKSKARSIWYHNLQKKDIWLRKLMQELKLYLKENQRTPGSSLFGTFAKGGK